MNLYKLHPFYIYRKRKVFIPYLRWRILEQVFMYRFLAARKGIYLTENEKKLSSLRNIHKGKRCFIIGNGPSLRIEDLDRLKSEITFASNKIYLCFSMTDWRPMYYSVIDDLVIGQNYEMINGLNCMIKIFPTKTLIFAPKVKNGLYQRLIFKKFYPDNPRFGFDVFSGFYNSYNVTYYLLQLAVFMGIKEIYLLGIDFNFVLPEHTKQSGSVLMSEGEVNHFIPEYRKPGEKWFKPKIHHIKKGYLAARSAIESLNGKIYNATRGGKLEVFERVDFDSLF